MTTVTFVALLLACGITLDFVTLKHRTVVFEQFYNWWCKLSTLNLAAAGNSGVEWFASVVNRVFGVKIMSIRSIVRGCIFVLIIAMLVTGCFLAPLDGSMLGKLVLICISAVLLVIPGLVVFQVSRLLLHWLERRITFRRVLMFGLINLAVVEATIVIAYASVGLFTAFVVKIGFEHQLPLADIVPVSSASLAFATAFVFIYLPTAVMPAALCLVAWLFFVLAFAGSKIGLWAQYFLKDRVEQKWEAPFVSICAVLAACITITSAGWSLTKPATWISDMIRAQTTVTSIAIRDGASVGAYYVILTSPRKPEIIAYCKQYAAALDQKRGIPTSEEFDKVLREHVPNLRRAWQGSGESASERRTSP